MLRDGRRARHRIYWELSRLRIAKNRTTYFEPTGKEVFDEDSPHLEAARSPAARPS